MRSNFLPLFAAITPFVVWPIELILPYPHFVEEILKAILVWWGKPNAKTALLAGAVFALSEAIFYLFNSPSALSRLIYTIPLHAATFLILSISHRRFFPLGLTVAILLHWLYNKFAGNPSLGPVFS